jgi:hypothetical protein
MSGQFNRSIIRFQKPGGGATVGTGFAIGERHVISCTHVVASVLGLESDQPLPPAAELDAEINLDGGKPVRLKVIKSFPRLNQPTSNDVEDITIMETVSDGTLALGFAPLFQQDDAGHYDQPFKTYGFNKPTGDWHDGICKGPMGAGWIQLQIENQTADKLNGLSGAPVWNKRIQAIVGMLVAKRGDHDAYMIPAYKLAKAWPELQVCKPSNQLPDQPDSEFLTQIKQNMATELDVPAVVLFRNALREELDKVLPKLGQPKIADDKGISIAEGLVVALKNGDDDMPVISDALTEATVHCFGKRGKYYQAAIPNRDAIQDTVEQVLGWLVVASVTDQYASALRPSADFPFAVYFELPVATPCGVEVIVSRSYRRQAKFVAQGYNVVGCHSLHLKAHQFTWQQAAIVDELKLLLWNQVFPDNKKTSGALLNKSEIRSLNTHLRLRRSRQGEHHLIAIECPDREADISYKEVYQQLLGEVNELTLIRFGEDNGNQVFYVPEESLMAAVNLFLNNPNWI